MATTTLDAAVPAIREASGPKPQRLTAGRIGLYAFLVVAALFFLLPLYVMIVTSLKPMDEIRLGNIFDWPSAATIEPWFKAWSEACTGRNCTGIRVGFWNSVQILDSERDPVDLRRRAERLRAVVLAAEGRQRAVRRPAARRLHPLPGVHLPAGAHLLDRSASTRR